MTIRRLAFLVAIAATSAALSTCKDPTSGPKPGYLDIRLTSPNVDDGGLYFTVGGARIDSVTTDMPVRAFHAVSDSLWHVVVGGLVATGPVARIWVPDTRHASQYTATVLQVVVRISNTQRSATGYALVAAAP